MTYTQVAYNQRTKKRYLPDDTIQFEFGFWLLTKTQVRQPSFIGDLAFMWFGF